MIQQRCKSEHSIYSNGAERTESDIEIIYDAPSGPSIVPSLSSGGSNGSVAGSQRKSSVPTKVATQVHYYYDAGGNRIRFSEETEIDYFRIRLTPSTVDALPSEWRDLYIQHEKDSDDKLLVGGYFRETIQHQALSSDINRIVASYYLKSYSSSSLWNNLEPIGMIYDSCLLKYIVLGLHICLGTRTIFLNTLF